MSTPKFNAGALSAQKRIQDEVGLFVTDFSGDAKRTREDVMGVPVGGTTLEWLATTAYGRITSFAMTGAPIPASDGSYQGLAALDDAATVASLANFVDGELFDTDLNSGVIVCEDPSFKKARSGTGIEITLAFRHGAYL